MDDFIDLFIQLLPTFLISWIIATLFITDKKGYNIWQVYRVFKRNCHYMNVWNTWTFYIPFFGILIRDAGDQRITYNMFTGKGQYIDFEAGEWENTEEWEFRIDVGKNNKPTIIRKK